MVPERQKGCHIDGRPSSGIATWSGGVIGRNSMPSYYRARYYDITIGRFTSMDPIGFKGGDNHYAFVKNNPLLLRDPKGTCPVEDCNPPSVPIFDSISAYLWTCPCRAQGDIEKTCTCIALPFGSDRDPDFMKQCKGCYGKESPRDACKCACTLLGDKTKAQCDALCNLLPKKWPK